MRKKITQAREEFLRLSPWLKTIIRLSFMAPSILWTPLMWWLFSENKYHIELMDLLMKAHKEELSIDIITGIMMADYGRLSSMIALLASMLIFGIAGAVLTFIFGEPSKKKYRDQSALQEG